MKRFNILFSLMLLAGPTCDDVLLASKKRKANFDKQDQKTSSDERVECSRDKLSVNIFSNIFINRQLTRRLPSMDLNKQDEDGNTALHRAAQNGNVLKVMLLIVNNAAIDIENNDKKTPLRLATENKKVTTKDFLQLQKTLFDGIRNESLEDVQAAINAGAYFHARDYEGNTPLHKAAIQNSVDIMQFLLDEGANVNAQNNEGKTPLHKAAACTNNLGIVQLLLDAGSHIDAQDKLGNTPLRQAAYWNRAGIVRLLLKKGAEIMLVDEYNKYKETPLAVAQQRHSLGFDRTEIIALLQS